jgi:hypothetical protein
LFGFVEDDTVRGVALGPDNSIFLCGETESPTFPATFDLSGSDPPAPGSPRQYLLKLSPDAGSVVWSALLPVVPNAVAVAPGGEAYLCGRAFSGFNATVQALGGFDSQYSGGSGVTAGNNFIARISADGSAIEAATWFAGAYTGGDSAPRAQGFALHVAPSDGRVYMTGITNSQFPAMNTSPGFDSGGAGYVACLEGHLGDGALVYATRLGSGSVSASSTLDLAVDAAGNAYVTGFDQVGGNNQDGFLAAFDASGASLWRDRFGTGDPDERGEAVGVGEDGALWAIFSSDGGNTDLSATAGAFQSSYGMGGGPRVSYVARLDPANGEILAGSFLGATLMSGNVNTLNARSVIPLTDGSALVSGRTSSAPVLVEPWRTTYDGGEGYVGIANTDLTELLFASYAGAAGGDDIVATASRGGRIVLAGETSSGDFEPTQNPPQTGAGGGQDIFLIVMDFDEESAGGLAGFLSR